MKNKYKVGDLVIFIGSKDYLLENSVSSQIQPNYSYRIHTINDTGVNLADINRNHISSSWIDCDQLILNKIYETEIYQALLEADLEG